MEERNWIAGVTLGLFRKEKKKKKNEIVSRVLRLRKSRRPRR